MGPYHIMKHLSTILLKMKDGSLLTRKYTSMKKAFIYIILIIGLAGCENQEAVFPDFPVKAVYFPVQLPLRTLSLGEDRIDNSLDKEFKFDIGVSIGGMYINSKNWTVNYVVDNKLTDSLYNTATPNQRIYPVPAGYYTLSPDSAIVIPTGSFNGLLRVQLTDQFFDDPLAIAGRYVIPLRITGSSADSVLSGMKAASLAESYNPDRRITTDWETGMGPKDWVLFGIKYVNAYHGSYLHRGKDFRYLTAGMVPFDTAVYHQRYVERDQVWALATSARAKAVTNGIGKNIGLTGQYAMELVFANNAGSSGSITIVPRAGSLYSVTGTGEYLNKATSVEGFGDQIYPSMYLSYTYTEGIYTHKVKDTLTFRDRGIKYEELSIVVKK